MPAKVQQGAKIVYGLNELFWGSRQLTMQSTHLKTSNDMNDLVRRLQQREVDRQAVSLLVDQYGGRVLKAATLLCGNETDAQDLMIETLERAMRSVSGFKGKSSFFSWLYGILFNVNRMAWRKRSRSPVTYMDEVPDVPADQPYVGSQIDEQATADRLAVAVRQLSAPLQEVVLLRYYGEMSIAEVAETLQIQPSTVKSRLFSATAKLKTLLPEEMKPG